MDRWGEFVEGRGRISKMEREIRKEKEVWEEFEGSDGKRREGREI